MLFPFARPARFVHILHTFRKHYVNISNGISHTFRVSFCGCFCPNIAKQSGFGRPYFSWTLFD
jgi:hypothetical protein